MGQITIKRAYYYCPDCDESLVPYDLAGGLGSEQVSPSLAKACCMIAVDDSFQQTSRKIEKLTGQKVSANTIERLVHKVGSLAIEQQDQSLEDFFRSRCPANPQNHPDRLYIAVDGTTAHEIDGWHEVKIGAIYWQDQCNKQDFS